jgi:hypothetical protein
MTISSQFQIEIRNNKSNTLVSNEKTENRKFITKRL